MSEEIRHRILAAAARVYAQYGFRGATTRLIATEADVNEVTLFRTFGSKAQLLQEMLQSHVGSRAAPTLPADVGRSEERRVGKECRSRGAPYPLDSKSLGTWNNVTP